jgi:MoxR-like ATPase
MSAITEARTVRISEAKTLITKAFQKKRPVFLWGPPGIGKSELVEGIAKSEILGRTKVIDMRLALFEPTDLRGYPVPDVATGVMKWLPPTNLF